MRRPSSWSLARSMPSTASFWGNRLQQVSAVAYSYARRQSPAATSDRWGIRGVVGALWGLQQQARLPASAWTVCHRATLPLQARVHLPVDSERTAAMTWSRTFSGGPVKLWRS